MRTPPKMAEQVALMRHQIDYYLNRARAAALAGALGTATDVHRARRPDARLHQIHRTVDFEDRFVGTGDPRFRGERQDFEEMLGNSSTMRGKWAARGRCRSRSRRRPETSDRC